ncbi:MAG: hypothetical protein Q7S63_02040 [bacterium]|nr:hypothetical protein [bacterium]
MQSQSAGDVREETLPALDQLDLYRQRLAQGENSPFLPRIIQALEAGYAEITLDMKPEWEIGFPSRRDPRPSQHPIYTNTILALLTAMASLVGLYKIWYLGFPFFTQEAPQFMIGSFLLFVILVADMVIGGVAWCSIEKALEKINSEALLKEGLPPGGTRFFLKQKLPSPVALRLKKARQSEVFDSIQVLAPAEAFKKVFLGDPIIFGRIGTQTFLIAQFNLGEDLPL